MKKRNLVIVAFMLVAAMTIGVGYAALSVQLTVNGTARVSGEDAADEFKEDVYFSNAQKVDNTGGSYKEDATTGEAIEDTITISDDKRSVTFAVKTLMGVNESVEYTFTVKNDSTMAATVTPTINIENTSGAYEVKVTEITDGSPLATGNTNGNSFELDPDGGTHTFIVKITLRRMPTDQSETYTLAFGIDLDAVINNP